MYRAMEGSLYKKLKKYGQSPIYPFHMPGHKRNMAGHGMEDMAAVDITEIEGFDDLHHPKEILKEAQKKVAALYGAEESCFLINGSTVGILSAVSGCTKRGGTILMARNCHRSVYNSVYLQELHADYLYPLFVKEFGIAGGISTEQVAHALEANKEIEAVVITSPTYEGVVSDVASIAQIVHQYNIPLIVDEAHGAHFGFDPYFPHNSVKEGADVVIHSLHKTLPALTQSGVIHFNGELADRRNIKKYLSIYQSSSPSYLLLASMEQCIALLKERGRALFSSYIDRLETFRKETEKLNHIKIINKDLEGKWGIYQYDLGKILISLKNTNRTGREIYKHLLSNYKLQMEMAGKDYVLAMTSIMDKVEGMNRLFQALTEIDASLIGKKSIEKDMVYGKAIIKCSIWKAENTHKKKVSFTESLGKVSGQYVYLYPPGIPLIAPGEEVTKEFLDQIREYRAEGFALHGLEDMDDEKLWILNNKDEILERDGIKNEKNKDCMHNWTCFVR